MGNIQKKIKNQICSQTNKHKVLNKSYSRIPHLMSITNLNNPIQNTFNKGYQLYFPNFSVFTASECLLLFTLLLAF